LAPDTEKTLPAGTSVKFKFSPYEGEIYAAEQEVRKRSSDEIIPQPAKYSLKFTFQTKQDLKCHDLFKEFDKIITHIRQMIEKSNQNLGDADVLFKQFAIANIRHGARRQYFLTAEQRYNHKINADFNRINQYLLQKSIPGIQIEGTGSFDNGFRVMEIVGDIFKQQQEVDARWAAQHEEFGFAFEEPQEPEAQFPLAQ
jgi:hypothetical protein